MLVDDISLLVYQILGRPITIRIGIPGGKVIIKCYRVFDACFLGCLSDIIFYFFKSKFRSMNTDDNESIICVFLIPRIEVWLSTDTVDTRVCPEIYEYHFTSKGFQSEW